MENEKGKVKLAILSFSILLMGIIGVAGGLSVIGKHFSDLPQTTIQLLVSLPCILIIIFSLIVGKIQEYISKKKLIVFGVICFIIGGTIPAFVSSFSVILVLRAIFGVGIGIMQPLSSALVVEHFEGDECSKVMGQQVAAQMIGCAAMVLLGGYLAELSWQAIFYLHLIAVISLIIVLVCLPDTKPIGKAAVKGAPAGKVRLTAAAYGWVATMFIFLISSQVYSVFIAFFIESQGLGTAAQAGQSLTVFALGGFLMGLVYGKLMTATKNLTLSVGFILLGIAYLMMVYAPNIYMIYAGSLVVGFACAIIIPCIVIGASSSVDPISAPMAISAAMCSQNLAQFVCPYVVTPIAVAMGGNVNKSAFLFAAALILVMGVIAVFWGIAKNRRQTACISS